MLGDPSEWQLDLQVRPLGDVAAKPRSEPGAADTAEDAGRGSQRLADRAAVLAGLPLTIDVHVFHRVRRQFRDAQAEIDRQIEQKMEERDGLIGRRPPEDDAAGKRRHDETLDRLQDELDELRARRRKARAAEPPPPAELRCAASPWWQSLTLHLTVVPPGTGAKPEAAGFRAVSVRFDPATVGLLRDDGLDPADGAAAVGQWQLLPIQLAARTGRIHAELKTADGTVLTATAGLIFAPAADDHGRLEIRLCRARFFVKAAHDPAAALAELAAAAELAPADRRIAGWRGLALYAKDDKDAARRELAHWFKAFRGAAQTDTTSRKTDAAEAVTPDDGDFLLFCERNGLEPAADDQ